MMRLISEIAYRKFFMTILNQDSFTSLTLQWSREGGCHPPNRFFKFFLRMERAFTPNNIFSCSLILGTSVHEKMLQIGPTVLALKLDNGRMLGGTTPSSTFKPIFLTMKMPFSLNKFWLEVR